MKRPLTIIAIAFLSGLVIYACGSTIRTADTSLVTITIGEGQKTALLRAEKATPWSRLLYFLADAKLLPKAYAAIPQEVAVVVVTVSAPDMTAMVTVVPVAGLTEIAITVEVPNGMNRNFLVEGFDASSIVVYRGQASVDLRGDPVSLTINLASVADTLPPTFSGLTLVSNTSYTSMQLSWSAATDNVTPSANIVYFIYQAVTPDGEVYVAPSYTTAPGATAYEVAGLIPGNTYYFVVRARDAAGNIDSNTVERSQAQPGLHVATTGDDTTGDGSSTSPFRTITQALSFPSGTNIFVSQGTYSSVVGGWPGSETFPLTLRTGTALFCTGLNYATVISGRGQPVTGVIMNDPNGSGSTLVDGCTIEAPSISDQSNSGIEDSGFSITIRNTKVLGTFSGVSFGQTGIVLGGDSLVADTVIAGFSGGEGGSIGVTIGGGNVLVTRSTVSGNDDGISISGGTVTIEQSRITMHNTGIQGNGISVNGGIAVIRNNQIEFNTTGVFVSFASPTITSNTIRDNVNGVMVSGSAGTSPLLNSNSIYCNSNFDLDATSAMEPFDATNNSWDHEPPTIATPATTACPPGTDICYSGPIPDYANYTAAVPGGCGNNLNKF